MNDDEQENLKDDRTDELPQEHAAFELASPELAEDVDKVRHINCEHHRERCPSAFLAKRHRNRFLPRRIIFCREHGFI